MLDRAGKLDGRLITGAAPSPRVVAAPVSTQTARVGRRAWTSGLTCVPVLGVVVASKNQGRGNR